MTVALADPTEARPQADDGVGTKQRSTGGLVEDLEAFIDDLHVLCRAHFAVRVGWSAIADNTGVGDAVEVEYGCGHGQRGHKVLYNPVLDVAVRVADGSVVAGLVLSH